MNNAVPIPSTNLGTPTELTENWREYTYPRGTETVGAYSAPGVVRVRIDKPRSLFVSPSGNHRIRTEDGNLHIVAPGWLHVEIDDSGKDWTV